MIAPFVRLLPLGLLAATPVCGQGAENRLEELLGRRTKTLFGYSIARAADLDGDGLDDVAVGACGVAAKNARLAGAVVVLSSKDGRLLRVHRGSVESEHLGQRLTDVGDLDGDGARDLAVGRATSLRVLSGCTGAVLWSVGSFNACLGRLGDADGDGRDELLLAAEWPSLGPKRQVVDADGRALDGFAVPGEGPLALVGDLDGDGLSELLHVEGDGRGPDGPWRILSLRKPEPVVERDLSLRGWRGALHVYMREGEPVAAVGLASGGWFSEAWGTRMGGVAVVSLRTLEIVLDVRHVPPPDDGILGFGASVLGLPDRDGDGLDELLVGGPDGFGGSLSVHSGRTGDRLWIRYGATGLGLTAARIPGEDGGRIAVGCAGWFSRGLHVEGVHVLSGADLGERFAIRHKTR